MEQGELNLGQRYLNRFETNGKSLETVNTCKYSMLMLYRWKMKNDTLLLENIPDELIKGITEDDVELFRSHLSQNLMNSSSNTYLIFLSSFYSWLQSKKYVEENPFILDGRGLEKFSTPKRQPITMELPEVQTMINYLSRQTKKSAKRDSVILSAIVGGGMRISEVLKMKPEHIEMKQLEDGTETYQLKIIGKGDKERRTILPENIGVMLRNYAIRNYIDKDEKMFNVTDRTIERNMKSYMKNSGLSTEYTPHKLRHTFATMLWEQDVPIEEIAEYLGHTSVNTTKDSYVNIKNGQRAKSAKAHPMNLIDL